MLLQILPHTSWMIEKVLKLGLQTFSIFIMAQTKCAQHQLPGRWNLYKLFNIFLSNLHLMPFAGMALVFPAPSYVNVKVMDVWRGRRVNRWLVDGQHFITWSRGRRGAEMLPSVTSEGENTQITPALSTQMDNIYIPTDPTLTFFSTDIIASYPGRESAQRWKQTDNFRWVEIWRSELRHWAALFTWGYKC